MGSRHCITTLVEKWRFECPRGERAGDGHTNWFPIDGVFRCKGCAELRNAGEDVEPETAKLRDKKTGRLVEREEIELDVQRGRRATG